MYLSINVVRVELGSTELYLYIWLKICNFNFLYEISPPIKNLFMLYTIKWLSYSNLKFLMPSLHRIIIQMLMYTVMMSLFLLRRLNFKTIS